MPQRDGIVKPKTKRSKRFLQSREGKLKENIKNAMIMKGGNSSETVTQALKDIYALKKPNAVMYKKKNITRPFEDQTSLEFFSKKSDCSLFLFGSHNKKRPNNLIFGRMFDFHVLDMIELGIEKFSSLKEIKKSTCPEGTKPMLVFAGDLFDTDNEYKRLRSILTGHSGMKGLKVIDMPCDFCSTFPKKADFFRGPNVNSVRLAGLEHLLHFTALEGKIYMRSYNIPKLECKPYLDLTKDTGKIIKRVLLKKSGCRTPRIELEEMGPSFDFALRRTHLASDDLSKTAHRQPKALKPKKKKNVSHDAFGTKFGRLHMQKQNLAKLQTRKMKGLRKRRGQTVQGEEETSLKKTKADE